MDSLFVELVSEIRDGSTSGMITLLVVVLLFAYRLLRKYHLL
jgi:hypothetical protein